MSSEVNREDDEHEDPSRAMETLTTTTTTTTLAEAAAANCRKEKRKLLKKLKRKQARKDMALKERKEEEEEEEDPEEQRRMELKEKEEAEMMEMQRKEFEERERLWLERAAKKKEEEAARLKQLEEEEELRKQIENENELNNEDDDWEYVEEGPAEIIWQGNEIIVKKKRVRVAKSNSDKPLAIEDANRPTSNPLPPQSKAFTSYKNESVSAQQVFESVSNQTPNFGTEQDKANCPFHIKTGACRFGSRCSRVHFYPDKSCTLLIKNMYNGPGLAWEQDEGLEGRLLLPNVFAVLCLNIRDLAQGLMEIQSYGLVCGWEVYHTDEEVERCYEEFYEDVHTEFLKFGEIVNFKVCRNGSFHLRGNVYVHYKSLESAMLAYHSINGRYFAGKQITCEYVGVTRWKVAICGEYMKSMFKTCSRGTACNFIHCFRNPGGDYEWADWDKPPPKYWVKKMDALFGPSDDVGYDRHRVSESRGRQRDSNKKITPKSDRYHSRRSRSRDVDYISSYSDEDNSDGNRSQRSRRSSRHKHLSSSRRTRSPHDDHDYSVGDKERHTRYSSSHSRHRSKWKDHYDHENVENNYKGNDYEVDEGKDRSKGGDYYRQRQNHSSRREHYSRREKEADLDEHMKSDKNDESNSRGWYDGKRHLSDSNSRPTSSETVDPSDRWESRTSFPDESKRSKSYCLDDHEPVNVEYKSHDHSSGGQKKIRSTSDSRSSYRVYSEKQGEEKDASCEDLHSEDNHEYYNHSKRRHSKRRSRHDKEHRIQNNETSTSRESRGKSDLEEEEACMPIFNNDTDYYSDKHQSSGRSLNDHNDSKKGKHRSKKKQENTSKDDRASRKRSRSRSPG